MPADTKLQSAIYVGHVEHDRFTPNRNRFRYKIHHLYIDLTRFRNCSSFTLFGRWRRVMSSAFAAPITSVTTPSP